MRKDISVAAEPRQSRGKNEARRLRVTGRIPAVVYGAGKEPVPVAVSPKEVNAILHSASGHNTIFNLAQNGDSTPVMVVDYQHDPIRGNLLHVDLKRIDLSQRITVKVPVVTHGEAKGVKVHGGLLELITREVEIECLPDEIPENFAVDVTELLVGQNIRASSLELSGSVKLKSPGDSVIAHVIALRAEATPAAEGAVAAPATAEPEVIKKGKKEEEAAADKDKKKK